MDQQIGVLFTGDFAPCGDFEDIVISRRESIFEDALSIIRSSDVSFVNLECPLTNFAEPIDKIGPSLRARPECIVALRPFTVVGLANNHILDYGRQGLNDTIQACRSQNLRTVGAGMTAEDAQRADIHDIKGVKVAILALAEREFNKSDTGEFGSALIDVIGNYYLIRQAKTEADIVIMTLHCGNEHFPYPRPGLRSLCKHYIDLGAEAVICHHPHVPGAYEYHNGKPIVYSLGNLIFTETNPKEDWNLGYMARLSIDCRKKAFVELKLFPYEQSVALRGLRFLQDLRREEFLERIERYRENLESDVQWIEEWEALVARQAERYIFMQYFPFTGRGSKLLASNTIANILYNRSNSSTRLNMIRCQSHLELLTSILERRNKGAYDA